jgi:hypothetical protein
MFLSIMNMKRKNETTADELALERVEELLSTLNDEPKTPQAERVEGLISLFGRITAGASGIDKAQAMAGIRKLLSRYRWVSYVAPTTEGILVLNDIADHMLIAKADLWEHEAVRDLLAAFPRLGIGNRPYIRRCASLKCQRWFFAPRKDKVTCSSACHQWLYENKSPEQRERKAASMRKQRKAAKELEERQNKRLGFVKGKRMVVTKRVAK